MIFDVFTKDQNFWIQRKISYWNCWWFVLNIENISDLTQCNVFFYFIHCFFHSHDTLNNDEKRCIHFDHARINIEHEQRENQFVEVDRIINDFENYLQFQFEINVWNFCSNDRVNATKWFMITFDLIDRMMCFNKNDFDRDFYVDNILFEFLNYELLFCIDWNEVKWFQICVDSIKSNLFSYMFDWNVFQSSIRLKTNCFVYHMKNRLVIEIKNVNDQIEIEIYVVFDDKSKSFRKTIMFLTLITVINQFMKHMWINVMIDSIKNFLKSTYWKMFESTM